ncbi:hypothetical protein ATPR_2122 [Acetobacter tropicalis NBRC 101654]|uniref:Uncharacterized protein n=1 Tax=Acetobacter tropicalis NBRC 101654 TaxID=749388 RepID=F7VFH3_9PROT|nr:hypothetical protein ATPR_2122 [Acetobacter tropicalis NBRC 101654]
MRRHSRFYRFCRRASFTPKNGTLYGIAPEDSASCWVQKKGHTPRPFAP